MSDSKQFNDAFKKVQGKPILNWKQWYKNYSKFENKHSWSLFVKANSIYLSAIY